MAWFYRIHLPFSQKDGNERGKQNAQQKRNILKMWSNHTLTDHSTPSESYNFQSALLLVI